MRDRPATRMNDEHDQERACDRYERPSRSVLHVHREKHRHDDSAGEQRDSEDIERCRLFVRLVRIVWLDKEQAKHDANSGERYVYEEDRAPACRAGQESPERRPDRRARERCERQDAEDRSRCFLADASCVRAEDAHRRGIRGGSADAEDDADTNERVQRGRERTGDAPDEDENEAAKEDTPRAPAIGELAHRRLRHRAGHVKRCDEPDGLRYARIERVTNQLEGRRDHARVDRVQERTECERRNERDAEPVATSGW